MSEHRKFFDSMAGSWDGMIPPGETGRLDKILDSMNIMPGESVLDAGCGTGILFPLIRKRIGEKGKITGLDISPGMLKKAEKKFPGEAELIEGDAESIPVEDGVFDRVICFSSFPHFKDRERALKEFYRVLKENGTLHIIHTSSREDINKLHAAIEGPVKNDRIPDDDTMNNIFLSAGFGEVSVINLNNSYQASARKV